MIIDKLLKTRILTNSPVKRPVNTEFFKCKPVIDHESCVRCGACETSCPVGAIADRGFNYDECIYCERCVDSCKSGAITMDKDIDTARFRRNDLRAVPIIDEPEDEEARTMRMKIYKRFGRSLNIREVDCGSCNGCDYEINGLNNPFNDIERFGIHFVASPRHADAILVTGCVSRNMEAALVKTYEAMPEPKMVIAVGSCACSGGIFRDSYATRNGIGEVLPVDMHIPGCPPRPQAILNGILKLIDK